MERESTDFSASEKTDTETDHNLVISGVPSNTEFCLVFDDEVVDESALEQSTTAFDSTAGYSSTGHSDVEHDQSSGADLDVETIKKKADEIANSLKKFRSSKSADTSSSQDYEPPEEFKRYHETSLYVAQKLKEDRLLFEESKKRNEAVRSSKRNIQRDISKIPPEEHVNFEEIHSLRQKLEKLENTVAHLQDVLDDKERMISEKDETIRNLSDSVSDEYAARLSLLEQSQEEIKRVKSEHAKTIERINASKEEFCNQLQVVRQKYLQVENELKLADFARCRLVSKNAELKEKIISLENEIEKLKHTIDEKDSTNQQIQDTKNYLSKDILDSEIKCVELIVNELYAYLVEKTMSNMESLEDQRCDDDDVKKILEKISDKLESTFYLIKDKLNSSNELEENLKLANDKIRELERLNEDNKQQEIKLKKLLATLKTKVQSESNACKELTEKLSESKERIVELENDIKNMEEWKDKYSELEKINENMSYQLTTMREKIQAMEFIEANSVTEENAEVAKLKEQRDNLSEKNDEISSLLEAKNREYELLMVELENLRKAQEDGNSSDKTENDFVVLRTPDTECEDKSEHRWKERYEKLCEDNDKLMASIRSMSEKAIEWENEKLTLAGYRQQCEHVENEYRKLIDELDNANRKIDQLSKEKTKAEEEADELNLKLDALEAQLHGNDELVRQQSSSNAELNERLRRADELNEKLQKELSKLQHNAKSADELKSVIGSLEEEKIRLLEDCEKFKTKYQRLQVYCKANINKDKSSDTSADADKYRIKCKELIASNKQLQQTLEDLQTRNEELEKLVTENQSLQEYCNEARQCIDSLKRENNELKNISKTLQKTNEAERLDPNIVNEYETLKARYTEATDKIDTLLRENSELRERVADGLVDQLRWLKEENEAQKEHFIEAARQIEDLTRENAQLKAQLETPDQELEWYKSEYRTQQEYNQQAYQRIESLSQENTQLKDIKETFDQQILALGEEARTLRDEISRMNNENQTLDATNEQLMEFCNKARQQITELNSNIEAFGVEAERLKVKCENLQTENEQLRDSYEDVERLKVENEMLIANNEQLTEYCNNTKQKLGELEEVHMICDELRNTVDTLRVNYEIQLNELREQLLSCQDDYSPNQRLALESELALTKEKLENCKEQLSRKSMELDETLAQLNDTKMELEKFRSHVEGVQQDAIGLVQQCSKDGDRLNRTIVELTQQNEFLSKRCESYDEYARFYQQVSPVIKEAFCISDQAYSIVDMLQERLFVGKMHQGVQCDCNRENDVDEKEREFESRLGLILNKIDELEDCTERLRNEIAKKEKELVNLNDVLYMNELAYERDLKELRNNISLEAEEWDRKLNEMRRDHAEELQNYSSMNYQYEQTINELRNKLMDYEKVEKTERDKSGEWMHDEALGDWDESELKDVNYIEALDQLTKRFSMTSFASDYKFDDTMDEFPLAFKLAELFQIVVTYYIDSPNSLENPYALELLKKFHDVARLIDDAKPTEPVIESVDAYGQLLVTTQRYERENKYLLDAVAFFEDLLAEYTNFGSELHLCDLIHRWRENIVFDTTTPYVECPVIDEQRVFSVKSIEEFNEAFGRWKESNVKRLEVLSIRAEIRENNRPAEIVLIDVYKVLETVKNKLHDLICDLHYIYSSETAQVNPVEFFEQIEEVNRWVEHSLKIIVNDETIQIEPEASDSERDEDSPSDGTSDEKHSDTVAELKSLLGESNRKIEKLVKELTDVKNSREYNEVRQLHTKLDDTLYQLHLRDVHCVELTQELTQLLSERDSLQLKLSTILRQNEQLRNQSGIDKQSTNLENKLEELQQVNYMKDPRISEPSRMHHASQMQLFSDDVSESSQRNRENKDYGGLMPSIFKWFTGDNEDK